VSAYPTKSAEWKEAAILIFWLLFEMVAAAVPFITWPILFYLIHRDQNRKPKDASAIWPEAQID
jgi:hypothetical protein